MLTLYASYVRELAVLRERLDLEECRDWKRHARTFMVKAQVSLASDSEDLGVTLPYALLLQGSSQQAQTEYLQKKLSMISAAAKNSRGRYAGVVVSPHRLTADQQQLVQAARLRSGVLYRQSCATGSR